MDGFFRQAPCLSRKADHLASPQAKPVLAPCSAQAQVAALKAIAAAMSREVELDVAPVFSAALAQASGALGAEMACLHLLDSEKQVLRLVEGQGLTPAWSRTWSRLPVEDHSPPALALAAPGPVAQTGAQAPAGLGGVLSVPVRGAEISVGSLSLLWAKDQPPDLEPQADFLATVGFMVGLAIEHAGLVAELVDNMNQLISLKQAEEERNRELARLNAQLEELAITDGLTSLANRRHFMANLEQEILRGRRLGHPLCLIMADLDHFKRLNDTLGHQAGDQALQIFSGWLKEGVRQVDTVGRYGGEEFAVLLVDCDLAAGVQVAEKLRRLTQSNSAFGLFKDLGGFTVSMGVAQLEPDQDSPQFIAAADQALYQAKKKGRNRVEPPPPQD